LKKIIAIIIIGTFAFYTAIPRLTVFAAEETAPANETTTAASGAAEKVAANAGIKGVNQKVIEGAVFAAALAVMAVAISSDSGITHGHGHGN